MHDTNKQPTTNLKITHQTLKLIKKHYPTLVQLSTNISLNVTYEQRKKLIEARPIMATLNMCSMSFANNEFRNPPNNIQQLAAQMQELRIKPELKIYNTKHLNVALTLHNKNLLTNPLQFSIILKIRKNTTATPKNLITIIQQLPKNTI